MRTSLVLRSGTTSAPMARLPDTSLNVILKPLVSLFPFFYVNCYTPIALAWAKSFPSGCYLTKSKLLALAQTPLVLHGARKASRGPSSGFFFFVYFVVFPCCLRSSQWNTRSSTYNYTCVHILCSFFFFYSGEMHSSGCVNALTDY